MTENSNDHQPESEEVTVSFQGEARVFDLSSSENEVRGNEIVYADYSKSPEEKNLEGDTAIRSRIIQRF